MTPGMVALGEAATEGRIDEKRRQNRARMALNGSSTRGKRGPGAKGNDSKEKAQEMGDEGPGGAPLE